MADRRYDLEDLVNRPGTYFNPQTEVLVVVDDSSSMDNEIFNLEQFEGADWVLIADDLPVDEPKRDELLEGFQATFHDGEGSRVVVGEDDDGPDPEPDDADPEPDAAGEAEGAEPVE